MPKASGRNFAPQDLQLTVRSVIACSLLTMQITHSSVPVFLPSLALFAVNDDFRSYPETRTVHQFSKKIKAFSDKATLWQHTKEVIGEQDPIQAGSQFADLHSICFAMAILALSPPVCRFPSSPFSDLPRRMLQLPSRVPASLPACLSAWVQPYSGYLLYRLHQRLFLPLQLKLEGTSAAEFAHSFCVSACELHFQHRNRVAISLNLTNINN